MITKEQIYFDIKRDMHSPYGSENISSGVTVTDNVTVMHGPYVQIPSGRWMVSISGKVENAFSCYADVSAEKGQVILGRGDWKDGKILFEINAKFPIRDFEVRFFANSGAFVRLDEIVLIKDYDLSSDRSFSAYQRLGLDLILDRSSMVDSAIITRNAWEPERIEALLDLAYTLSNGQRDLIFLDIGSYFGLYSLKMAQTNMFERIIAFEADQFNYRQLSANLLLNDPQSLIEPIFMAVSDSEGSAHFVSAIGKADGNRGGAGISTAGIIVAKNKIDNIVKEKNRKIIIKIDVEGHEPLVIPGMKELLQNNLCALQIECFDSLSYINSMLTDIGYKYIKTLEHDHYFSNF
ncbi:FkbM family methyltransferase [Sphingobium xenophagum]|uniref:FkbM family methyltransferase n=1 Tax=Sphingobium xenophagum TaxID=121428 RepID=A0ABU1WXQ5_SPHXE|nr:FkbM family methyltransferase [Sphingobium xenophagum]MDR7154092.1 FkbM family methyltransferase [Sphingobium xenophagum]